MCYTAKSPFSGHKNSESVITLLYNGEAIPVNVLLSTCSAVANPL